MRRRLEAPAPPPPQRTASGCLLDLVDMSEIAKRTGRSLASVQAWRYSKELLDPFPEPLVVLSVGPIWEWEPVRAWKSRLKPPGRPSKATPASTSAESSAGDAP